VNHTGRYAPSPTGPLHLGNLRTAVLAWLLARSQGAAFLMRIEDLDRQRSRADHEAGQLADLRALGLDWDDAGAEMRQSERDDAYADALGELERAGLLYECFCTRAEIREAASAPHGELPEGAYPGTCRELSAAERRERERGGRPAALRVRADGERIGFDDRLYGKRAGLVDDFVVRRNDGTWGYNLAVVVDDAAQGIGEVVRGRDLLGSTPRQIWLGRHLGLPEIGSWAHMPLVLGPGGERLAKRDGAVTLAEQREIGHGPAEVLAVLASSVGLCDPGERPTPAELLDRFDPSRLPLEDGPLPGLEPG
jgi:glutamyl-tRNA synthetase